MLYRDAHSTPAKILIVEDEQIIAYFVSEALERLGYVPVAMAESGDEAIRAAREHQPDIVLMDIILKESMDGIEAARRIRAERDVPIIYVTSNADQDTVDRARDTEPSGYLNKPINERDLLTNIDSALYKHSMEKRLRESEERYRRLITNISDIIYSLDGDGRITFMSPPIILISGYAPEELAGKPFTDFVHAEDTPALEAARKNNTPDMIDNLEFRIITKRGGVVWVRTSARKATVEGRPAGLNGVLTDITERKKAESQREAALGALRESEERYRILAEASPDMIYIVDAEGVIGYVNRVAAASLGMRPEECTGTNLAEHFPTEIYERQLQSLRSVIRTGQSVYVQAPSVMRGKQIWLDTWIVPIRYGGGEVVAAMGISRDITERRMAENALHDSEERYRIIAEQTGQLVYDYEISTGRITWSGAIMEITGYAGAEFQEGSLASWQEMIHPEDRAHAIAELDRSMADQDKYRVEYRFRRRDGDYFYAEDNGIYLRDERGAAVRMLGTMKDVTERKRAEEALRESERRYRFFLDNFQGIAYQVYTDDGEPAFLHGAIQQITGFTEDDIMSGRVTPGIPGFRAAGAGHRRLVHPDDVAAAAAELAPLADRPGASVSQEFRILRSDGQERWVHHSAQNFGGGASRPFIQGVVYDVTERMKAENARREYELLLETVFRELPVVIGIAEVESGAFLTVNEEFLRVSGFARDEVIGHTTAELGLWVVPSDRERLRGMAGRDSADHVAEVMLRDRRGRLITALMNVTTITLGGRACFLSVVQDISDRKKAQDALAEEKERLMVTLRSIGDGVITTDTGGCVVLMNRIAEELTGWTMEEAAGKHLGEVLQLLDRSTRAKTPDPAETIIRTGGVNAQETQALLVNRAGTEMIIAHSGAPIRDKESRILGAVLVFRDITERERIEEGLRSAQKLESIGMLAGGIAHDFNNLLTGIFGYLELARISPGTGGEAADHLASAVGVFNRAKDLTQQLLTFSKDIKPIRKPASIGDLVRKSVGFALSGSKINAKFIIPDRLWMCEVNESQIGQVIDNIVINAQQAMPDGGTITVTAENVVLPEHGRMPLPQGRYVLLVFSDQGVGIPRDIISRIFDPFFTTKQKGSGLGLATSYSIIRKHDGHLEASSEPGKGSAFSIYLPAVIDAHGPRASRGLDDYRGSGKVLLMDDEGFIKDVAGRMLKHLGYSVETVAEGSSAVALFRQAHEKGEPFDAVILDLTVPGGMGGVETVAKLREIDPGVRAIASSGYSVDPVMARPLDYGFSGMLVKPFKIEELGKIILDVVRPGRK